MESTHFLHIVEKQCKMRIGYFQHYWWDMQAFTLMLMFLALPALVLIEGLLVSDEFKDRFFWEGGLGGWTLSFSIVVKLENLISEVVVVQCFFTQNFFSDQTLLPHPDLGSEHSSPPFALSLSSLIATCLLGGFVFLLWFILNPDYFRSPACSTDAQTVYLLVGANGWQGKNVWRRSWRMGLDAS